MDPRISRRSLIYLGLTGAAAVLLGRDVAPASLPPASPALRGVTFIPNDVRYWGRDPAEVLDALLAAPGLDVVRLPLYSWETATRDGRWVFRRHQAWLDRIVGAGHRIVPVIGIKQPGYPEVHLPWRIRRASSADQAGVVLDGDPLVREFALAMIDAYVGFLKPYEPHIAAVQVENEANYPVALAEGRRISNEFLAHEVALVRQGLACPVMCTYPDSPSLDWESIRLWHEGLRALRGADLVGFNHYPQKLHPPGAAADRLFTLRWLRHVAFPMARSLGLAPAIAEMQVTPWVEGKEAGARPFSVDLNVQDVRSLEALGPSLLLLWGIDYAAAPGQEHLWRHVTSLLSA